MQAQSDAQLLREYAESGSEPAFGEIVARHTDLVYSAALRQVGSADLARDIAQSVFADLARKARPLAGRLAPEASLVGWLYRGTRYAALTHLRNERRRLSRERQVMEHFNPASEKSPDWEQVGPVLDEAMADLDDEDRDALLLRFFKNRDFRAVGVALGVSDDAAQKRVSRALEKLRGDLLRRGVTTTAVALSAALSANAVSLAPAGLATALTGASLAGATAGSGTSLTLLKLMATTKLKAGLVSAAVAASVVTTLVIQNNSAANVRDANAAVHRQMDHLGKLQAEHNRLADLARAAANPANTPGDLERLRGEVAALRQQTNGLKALREESYALHEAVQKARRGTQDPNVESTERSERAKAKVKYASEVALALWRYASEHDDRFPTDLTVIQPIIAARIGEQEAATAVSLFEVVYHDTKGSLAKYANIRLILLIREKQPWKNTDGKMVKVYADAGGVPDILSVADGNFEAWEKQHIVPPESPRP